MATLKAKDLKNMAREDRDKKLKELKLELVKSKVHASKTGTSKAKEIKKIIARILTFNKSEDKTNKATPSLVRETSKRKLKNK